MKGKGKGTSSMTSRKPMNFDKKVDKFKSILKRKAHKEPE